MGRGPVTAQDFLRAITQAPYPRADRPGCGGARCPYRSPFCRFRDYRAFTALAPGRRRHEVLGRPHAGLSTGCRPLLSHHPAAGTSPRGRSSLFCFYCYRPILLLADSIPVHDRHRRVSGPDRQRRPSDRSHLKLLQAARLLVCSPLRARSVRTDPRHLCVRLPRNPRSSASCRRSTSSLPITPSSSTCRNAASI